MKLSTFLIVKTIVSLVFAIALLVLPGQLATLWDMASDPATILMARYVGVGLLGIGLVCWFLKDAPHSETRQGILLSLFLADSIGFIVALYGQLTNVMGALGWVNVVIWLLLAVGLAYFRFVKPQAA